MNHVFFAMHALLVFVKTQIFVFVFIVGSEACGFSMQWTEYSHCIAVYRLYGATFCFNIWRPRKRDHKIYRGGNISGKRCKFLLFFIFPFHFHWNLCTALSYIDSCSILFILHVFLEPCTRVLWFIWRDFKVLQYLQVKGKHFFDFKVHYNFWKMFSVICSLYVIHLCIGAIFPVQSTSCPKRCKIDKYWTFVCNVNR